MWVNLRAIVMKSGSEGNQAASNQFPSHADQYKMLREEIVQNVAEIYKTQLWGATATVAIYTWLLTHTSVIPWRYTWYIAPCVVVICIIRCLDLIIRIRRIAKYQRRIESAAFRKGGEPPGWETYKATIKEMDSLSNGLASAIWIFALVATFAASWQLSKADRQKFEQVKGSGETQNSVTNAASPKAH